MRTERSGAGFGVIIGYVVALCGAGCAPSLTTMAPARIVPEGHLQLGTAVEATDTQGEMREAVEALDSIRGTSLDETELRTAIHAASAALVQPPSIGFQVSAAYGVADRFEIGIRSSVNAVRGHARWQFFKESPGWYGVLGLGISGYIYGFPLQTFNDFVELKGHTRWDLDVPLHFGFSNRYVHVWGEPKLVLSTTRGDVNACLRLDASGCAQETAIGFGAESMHVGGQVGVAVGYRQFWVGIELSIAWVGADARVEVEGPPSMLEEFGATGIAIQPALGLVLWI